MCRERSRPFRYRIRNKKPIKMIKTCARKKNRLDGYDYSNEGLYFITICTQNKNEWFGAIENNQMRLNIHGEAVKQQWEWLANQYSYVISDVFGIMPNHIHGILAITRNGLDRSLHRKSLSSLIGAFKTTSSKLIRQNGLPEFKWQKSFHDHIIRNDKSLHKIHEYIINNPATWADDKENIKTEADAIK